MKVKPIKRLALCLLLALLLTVSVSASAAVPNNVTVENLNGQQRMVKTYVLPPQADPEKLKEPSFEYDGFSYAWAYTTKEEHPFLDSKAVTETVSVETSTKDLNTILGQLESTIAYDDGTFSGELTLDRSTLSTVASGYVTKSGQVTAVKLIGPLDRNDMSYVPATMVKNGVTLTLSNVEWQVIGTDLVGELLAPSSYQALATYTGSTSYQAAAGYTTTAEYKGEVISQGVRSITYQVVYEGSRIEPEKTEDGWFVQLILSPLDLILGGILLLAALAGLGIFLFRRRKNVCIYVPGDQPRDYQLIAKFRVQPDKPEVDIRDLEPYPEGIIAVEIKRSLAKKLLGQTFTVHHRSADYTYTVLRDRPGDWHEFDPSEEKEESV